MNNKIFLVPKPLLKQWKFWVLIAVIALTVVVTGIEQYGVNVPDIILLMTYGLAGIFIGTKNIAGGKEAASNILNCVDKDFLIKWDKPLVNEKSEKIILPIAGAVLAALATMVSQGATINPWVIVGLKSVVGIFIGTEKAKNYFINNAANLVKAKN